MHLLSQSSKGPVQWCEVSSHSWQIDCRPSFPHNLQMRSVSSRPQEGLRLAVSEKSVWNWECNSLSFNIRFHFKMRPLLKSNFPAIPAHGRYLISMIFRVLTGVACYSLCSDTRSSSRGDPFHYAVTPPFPSSHPLPHCTIFSLNFTTWDFSYF